MACLLISHKERGGGRVLIVFTIGSLLSFLGVAYWLTIGTTSRLLFNFDHLDCTTSGFSGHKPDPLGI